MNCIYQRNSASGFAFSHRVFCARECDADATHHVNIGGFWCANLCKTHADLAAKRSDAEMSHEIFTRDEPKEEKRYG